MVSNFTEDLAKNQLESKDAAVLKGSNSTNDVLLPFEDTAQQPGRKIMILTSTTTPDFESFETVQSSPNIDSLDVLPEGVRYSDLSETDPSSIMIIEKEKM